MGVSVFSALVGVDARGHYRSQRVRWYIYWFIFLVQFGSGSAEGTSTPQLPIARI